MSNGKKKHKKDTPTKQSPQISNQNATIRAEQFQGPIPPPSILNQYNDMLPGAADRIIAMAEKEAAHRHKMEEKALDAEIKGLKAEAEDTKRGQFFGFFIALAIIAGSVYAGTNGAQWTGSLLGVGGIGSLVSVFIIGRQGAKKNQSPNENKELTPTEPQE